MGHGGAFLRGTLVANAGVTTVLVPLLTLGMAVARRWWRRVSWTVDHLARSQQQADRLPGTAIVFGGVAIRGCAYATAASFAAGDALWGFLASSGRRVTHARGGRQGPRGEDRRKRRTDDFDGGGFHPLVAPVRFGQQQVAVG